MCLIQAYINPEATLNNTIDPFSSILALSEKKIPSAYYLARP